MTYVVIAIAVIVVVAVVSMLFTRTRKPDDVDRFLRARGMTSAWSRGEPTPPAGRAAGRPADSDVYPEEAQSPSERHDRVRNSAT